MFYIKTIHDGKTIEVEIYGDEIYTRCFNCGKEIQADTEILKAVFEDGGDLSSTSFSCCGEKKPQLTIVK